MSTNDPQLPKEAVVTLYCAIDLHSNNNVPVVIDDNDKILFQ